MAEEIVQQTAVHIVADPARDYRWKRSALVSILFVYGILSIKDGFVVYPRENAENVRNGLAEKHPGFDVPLNKALGVLLPPIAIIFLAWVFYNSRGSYQFDGTNILVPGHPPIPLNALRKVDRQKWDRKGIAYIEYQIPGTQKSGRFKLDDFIYRREPTDKIFEIVEQAVAGLHV